MKSKLTFLNVLALLFLMVFSIQISNAQCCNVDLGEDRTYCGDPITIGPKCMAVNDCVCCTNTPVLPNGDMECIDTTIVNGVCSSKLPKPWVTTFPTNLNVGWVNPANSPILTHSGESFNIPISPCGGACLAISFAGVDTLAPLSDAKINVSDLCVGNQYEVCWDAWTSDASVNYTVNIAGNSFPITNIGIWQERCVTFTATASTEVLQYLIQNDFSADRPDLFIDCAEITEVNCGGGNSVDYQWNTGATTPDIIITTPGTYCLTVTDCSGCKATDCVIIRNSLLLCQIIGNNPNHPDADGDCDNGGVDNYTECQNGGDPNNPADDCQIAATAGVDICLIIGSDPTHPMANLDCDNGGVTNYIECTNGGDPADPADDCESAITAGLNICTLIGGSATHPLAQLDCDGGGVVNYRECLTGEDPADPEDDCQAAIDGNINICVLIGGNPNHPMANLDCDNGGVPNLEECLSGENPSIPADDCQAAIDRNLDICVLIGGDPTHPMANQDCDGGGVDNYTECSTGEDPADPADDCQSAIDGGLDICAIIGNNPAHPMANQDCDNGGITNYIECQNGEDPSDPADDCQAAIDGNVNICTTIGNNPNHPLADQDCDNGGVPNYIECQNGEDPTDPADDCQAAVDAGLDICMLIGGDPTHPMANQDCDNGGIDNYTECSNGGDPNDPVDDCDAAINAGVDICALIGISSTHPLAQQDCDNGGITNYIECVNGEDPTDPADDCQAAIDGNVDICATIGIDSNHPLATQDCDNGGVDNYTECQTGEEPNDPADDCQSAQDSNADICTIIGADPSHPMAAQDCDNGGVPNYEECMNGGDPNDPLDDCDAAVTGGVDICALIGINQNHPLATLDCDNGGVPNWEECITNGADPLDPADDCTIATVTNLPICTIIGNDPNHPLATLDCDDGGVNNYDECTNGADPDDSGDDCQAAIDGGLDLCVLIGADPNHPLANQDCDNGGVDNYTECQNGGNPIITSDDCEVASLEDQDICAVITSNPNHPWATMDCDRGGVDNQTECQNGGDPNDPIDDSSCAPPDWCVLANGGALDICAVLTNDPGHPLSTLDCDGDGVLNPTECTDATDPLDPCDFESGSITEPVTADQSGCLNLCPDLTPITTILPGNIAGMSAVDLAVEVSEINLIDTDGSAIIVRVPSDPRYVFVWDIGLTMVALTPVQNSQWNYLGDNGLFHSLSYNGPGNVINGGTTSAFGFKGTYDPQSTDGQTTFTATIVPFSGGECNIINNTDSERLVYFE